MEIADIVMGKQLGSIILIFIAVSSFRKKNRKSRCKYNFYVPELANHGLIKPFPS